jgi:hypothetical protein
MKEIDPRSFQLGMINCFAEMVAAGVKALAISPPLAPEEYEEIKEASEAIVAGSGIHSHLDMSLLITDLQSAEFTRGKWSVLYFKARETLEAYEALKERKAKLEAVGAYDADARREISTEFMRLLSYPQETIDAKLEAGGDEDPYILLGDDQAGSETTGQERSG